jgi:hypothetical protein
MNEPTFQLEPDPLSQSQQVRRRRLYEAWLWFKQNLLAVAIIWGTGAAMGHLEAYIGFGYRLSHLEKAFGAMPDAKWQQKIDDHDADYEKRISRIEDNLNLDLNEKLRAKLKGKERK